MGRRSERATGRPSCSVEGGYRCLTIGPAPTIASAAGSPSRTRKPTSCMSGASAETASRMPPAMRSETAAGEPSCRFTVDVSGGNKPEQIMPRPARGEALGTWSESPSSSEEPIPHVRSALLHLRLGARIGRSQLSSAPVRFGLPRSAFLLIEALPPLSALALAHPYHLFPFVVFHLACLPVVDGSLLAMSPSICPTTPPLSGLSGVRSRSDTALLDLVVHRVIAQRI
jgi:hypothetical protein